MVESLIPAEVGEETSSEFIAIVEECFRELLALTVEKYGTEGPDKRLEFAERKAEDFLCQGPAILGNKTVAEILAVGFADDIVEATFTGLVITKLAAPTYGLSVRAKREPR